MKLNVTKDYNCSVDTFWEMYWSDSFDKMLVQGSTVDREVIEEKQEGEVLFRRLRFTPKDELPRAAAALLGTKKLIYEQMNHFIRTQSLMKWKVLPTILPGKLTAEGVFKVVPTSTGCQMIVEGDIVVKVRFIGGKIEAAVVRQVEDSYTKMASVAKRWLSENKA